MRARQARLLVPYEAVVLPGVLAAAAAAVLFALWVPAGAPEIARWPGWAAAALAAGAVCLLEEPAATLAAASPAPPALRAAVRLGLGLPALAGAWVAVVALAGPDDPAELTIQAAALVAITLAAGAELGRRELDQRAAMLVPLVVTIAYAMLR